MSAKSIHAEKSTVPTTDATVSDSPLKLLLIPFYFSSPLNTLLESLHDPDCNQVMFHDIVEAYDCFSDRIRSVATPLMQGQTTHTAHPALKIIGECSFDLAQVLKRDLRRAVASPSSQSQQSFHMYSYGSDGTSLNAYHALDFARLAERALCLISDICIFRDLYSLFSGVYSPRFPPEYRLIYSWCNIASDLQFILDDLFAFTVTPGLSMLNGPKICSLIVWILRVQRLPADILLERKGDISLTLERAITGYFGPQAVIDGLKVVLVTLLLSLADLAISRPFIHYSCDMECPCFLPWKYCCRVSSNTSSMAHWMCGSSQYTQLADSPLLYIRVIKHPKPRALYVVLFKN